MAFTTVGDITVQQIFAVQPRAAGSVTLGPVAVPSGFSRGKLIVNVTQITDLTAVLTVNPQIAFDGVSFTVISGGFGVDFPALAAQGYVLGAGNVGLVAPNGDIARTASNEFPLLQPNLTTRQVQATFSLSAPATLGMTLAVW